MNFFTKIRNNLPSRKSLLLAVISAVVLIFAFPDFEFSFLAWFGFIPFFLAIENEKASFVKSFLTGWVFGTVFFFGTCWWLTFAPITYAKFPTLLAYFLLLCATSAAGLFPAFFGGIFSLFLRRFEHWGILSAPFLWTALEFLRLWTTGNNWNAIGYSQAFNSYFEISSLASLGGVFLVGFCIIAFNAHLFWSRNLEKVLGLEGLVKKGLVGKEATMLQKVLIVGNFVLPILILSLLPVFVFNNLNSSRPFPDSQKDKVIAVQPNVPMSGLTQTIWRNLRQRQIELAENALQELKTRDKKVTVILPESPMNFHYEEDAEFRGYINDFAKRNNVSVLFNSAEPDKTKEDGYFNSAVLINEKGEKVTQYDKIYLLPFGEKVPLPESIEWIIPTMVGRFSSGVEYDLLPLGDAKAGAMICFESHFPSLSREYVRRGADVLIEMTNDGYLGNTPVLRQHLASGVFRAIETNRPVLRVTNVGITTYINERGEVADAADVYTEATRVWSVSKSDGKQTFYVKYGEWFALLCSFVSLALLFFCFLNKKDLIEPNESETIVNKG